MWHNFIPLTWFQSYKIKSPPWTILWFRILGIFSVENIKRLCVFMFETWDNSQLLRRVLWISAELTIVSSLKHKNMQPLYIFNKKNPQNSEPQNGPRRGLDFIALSYVNAPLQKSMHIAIYILMGFIKKKWSASICFACQCTCSVLRVRANGRDRTFWGLPTMAGMHFRQIWGLFIQKALFSTWVHGLRTHDDDKIRNSLQPKSISQAQKENPLKCMKILGFCRQNGWVMQNHGIGKHSDKIWADFTTKNTSQII